MIPTEAGRIVPVNQDTVSVDGLRSPLLHAGPTGAQEAVVSVHGNPDPAQDWRLPSHLRPG